MSQPRASRVAAPPPVRLGTFAGVFTPSILTILGIILFLRLGFVVGNAGLGKALLIIAIANTISVLTSISLSAIATSLRVKAGGDYYVISRTLGVAFGGALGIVLYLSQAVSIAFYAIGFGEATAALVPDARAWLPQAIAAGAVAVLFVLAWAGSDWASRFQFVVMAVLFAAIVSFFVGGAQAFAGERLAAAWTRDDGLPFWAIFAIFFPAVTGFTQGVSMSGDLQDPGRSIPRGTFLAVGISAAIYLTVAVVFAGAMSLDQLAGDYAAMRKVAHFAWLADAGVIAATLSSALASFLGAPRILQSMGRDKILPGLGVFAKGSGPLDNPRRGVLLSAAIALGTIALGDLNLIAPIVSMFFLISYGLLNYATYYEAHGRSVYFRPRFRWFHKNLSLLAALVCLLVMFLLQPVAAAAAIAWLAATYWYLRRTVKHERWADSTRSTRFQRVRNHLLGIAADREGLRDWRPVLLAFSSSRERRERLLRFARWLEGESGLCIAVQLLEGSGAAMRKEKAKAEDELRGNIRAAKFDAFPLVVTVESLATALPVLLQSVGLGPIRANTVLLNWFDGPVGPAGESDMQSYSRYLQVALACGYNVVVLEATDDEYAAIATQASEDRRVDVLYVGDATSRLILLFAYLMTRTEAWARSTIRVLTPRSADGGPEGTLAKVTELLDEVRIDAKIELLPTASLDAVAQAARDASLVFLPFHFKGDRIVGPFRERDLTEVLERLPMTAFVLAAQEVVLDAEPEAGVHGEIANALDEAERTSKSAKRVEKAATACEDQLATARAAVERAEREGVDAGELKALRQALDSAEQTAQRATRRAAGSKAKAEAAADEARRLTGEPPPSTEPPRVPPAPQP